MPPLTVGLALRQAISVAHKLVFVPLTTSINELLAFSNGCIVVVGREVCPAGSWIGRQATRVHAGPQGAEDLSIITASTVELDKVEGSGEG